MAELPFAGEYRFDADPADMPIVLDGDPRERNGHVLIGRAHLYNKQMLRERLGISGLETDADHILAAYLRFGEDCLEHLNGDFAFALWDPERAVLFCARDHFGVEPFHYALSDREFIFAGDLNLIPPAYKSQIDDAVIGDFLLGHVADATSCFYRDIARLPPAHCATIDRAGMRIRRYWRLQPVAIHRDPAAQFRDLFDAAVRSRLDDGDATGILLSGGLDSSSIACTARRVHDTVSGASLPTFSLVYERGPERSERRYIDAVLAQGGFDATILSGDDQPPLEDFGSLLIEQDGPFLAPHLAGIRKMFLAARSRGVSVMLDGHGGDEVVSHGHARLNELAKAGRWRKLWTELYASNPGVGGRTALWLDLVQRHADQSIIGGLAGRMGGLLPGNGDGFRPGKFVDHDFARRVSLGERARGYAGRGQGGNARDQHIATLESPLQAYAFEVLHRLNRATGLTGRYPFWDKRLVEFCVSVPVDQQLDGGWSRLILRRAMDGILPRAVQQRRDKFNFAGPLVSGILAHHRVLIDDMIGDASHPLFGFVDRTAIANAFARLCAAPRSVDGATVQLLWRAVTLGIWLDQRRSARGIDPLARAA